MKRFLILLFSLTLVLSGCMNTEKRAKKQNFTYYEATELQSIDPAVVSDDAGFNVVSNSFEGLFGYDKDHKLIPLGAESFPPKKKGTHFEIHLRKDAKWSNGKPVTAQDYLTNFKRAIDLNSPYKVYFEMFKNGLEVLKGEKKFSEIGISKKDDYTLIFDLNNEVDDFFELLTLPVFFPVSKENMENGGDFNNSDTLVYNGPFTVKKLKVGSNFSWMLYKNNEYWDKDKVSVEKIEGRVVKDNGVRLGNYNEKKASLIPIIKVGGRDITQDPEYHTNEYYETGFVLLNQNTPLFSNLDVRKMIYFGTNRQEVIDWALYDFSEPTLSILPEKSESLKMKQWKKQNFDFDMDKVKDLYDEYKKNHKEESHILRIIAPSQAESRKIAESLQYSIEKAIPDFQIVIETLSPKEYSRRFANKDYELAVCQTLPTVKNANSFIELFSANFLTKSLSNIPEENLNEFVEKQVTKEHWVDPLYQTTHSYLVSSKLKGVEFRTSGASLYFKNSYLVN